MKKLLCVIFALALVTATLTPVALVSAGSNLSFAAEADEETIKVGEKVIVTFSLDESADVEEVKSGNVVMTFGDTFEAVEDDDTCWLLKNTLDTYDFKTNKGGFAFKNGTKTIKKTADIFSIELKALKTATSADITADFEFKTIDGTGTEVTLGTGSATATVTVQSAGCSHTNTEPKYSATEHWTYCKDCQTEVSGTREAHKGGTATCEAKAECEVCGQEYGGYANCEFTAEVVNAKYLKSAATCQAYATYYKSCPVCGKASSTEYFEDTESGYGNHNFETTAWTTDGTTHWHKCLVDGCTAKDSEEGCSYSEQHNDTQHWDECDTCHNKKDYENHEYGSWITTDADKHWKECGCGVKALEANHVYDNDCDDTCNTCGHTRTITHSYDETTWKTSSTQHWHECTVCHDKKDIENHGWSEEVLQDGSNLKQAADCTNAAQYWKVCEDCGKISTTEYFSSGQPADHSYTAKVISGDYFRSEKTCTAYATYYYKCTGCTGHSTTQYWEDEDGGYAQHNFSAEVVDSKYLVSAADCQHYAVYNKSCTACGAKGTTTFEDTKTGYGNHNFDTLNWTSDGTNHWHKCLVDGCTAKNSSAACSYSKQYSEGGTQHWDECATCHNQKNFENHEYGNWITTDDTKHWKECGCGVKSLEANHEYDNDCDDTCNTCGHTRQITHDYDTTIWKSNDTQHWHECKVCHDKTDKANHTWDSIKLEDGSNLKSPATCTAYAVYYKACSICHKIDYNNTFDDVTGGYAQHVYEQGWTGNGISHWHKCSNPSCDSTTGSAFCSNSVKYDDTQHWTECDVCHYKQDYEGHSYSNWTATETEHYKACECGHKILEGEHTFVANCDDNDHWTECSECKYEQVGSREAHTLEEIILPLDANLKTPATATTPAEYYKACECGYYDKTQTFFEKDYQITQGDASKWEGTGELSFRSNADFDKFVAVLVDDEVVDETCYTAKSGSTVVTFTEEYLKTLSVGEHTITIQSTDGDATGKFTVAQKQSDDPGTGGTPGGTTTGTTQKTGDNSSALLWIMITIAAAIAMTVVFVAPRKKER